MEHARAGILEFDYATHRIISVNDSFLDICGYSQSEISAMAPEDLMTEPSRKLFKDRLSLRMAGKSVSDDVIYEFLTKKGEKKWVMLTANVTQAGGRPQIATTRLTAPLVDEVGAIIPQRKGAVKME